MPETIDILRDYIRNRFEIPSNDPDFSDDVDLFSYGYIDSFGALELTAFIEQRFAIEFADADWITHPMNSIREISSFISQRLSGSV